MERRAARCNASRDTLGPRGRVTARNRGDRRWGKARPKGSPPQSESEGFASQERDPTWDHAPPQSESEGFASYSLMISVSTVPIAVASSS